jgi:hypothetical protein
MLHVGHDHERFTDQGTFDFPDRHPMGLAFPGVGFIPVKAFEGGIHHAALCNKCIYISIVINTGYITSILRSRQGKSEAKKWIVYADRKRALEIGV